MTWRTKEGDREAIRFALRTRNTGLLDAIAVAAGLLGVDTAEFEQELKTAIAEQDHATQEWWGAPCNCDGHLN